MRRLVEVDQGDLGPSPSARLSSVKYCSSSRHSSESVRPAMPSLLHRKPLPCRLRLYVDIAPLHFTRAWQMASPTTLAGKTVCAGLNMYAAVL